jgi:drug/metabolite transporter (DMT)-like permease
MTTTRKELAWRIIVSVCLAIAVFLGFYYTITEALQQVDDGCRKKIIFIALMGVIWFLVVLWTLAFIAFLFVDKRWRRLSDSSSTKLQEEKTEEGEG